MDVIHTYISDFMDLSQILKRHKAAILWPTISFGLIFLDWNHTRKWKLRKAKEGIF